MAVLLIVNPNTSAEVSALLEREARRRCPADARWHVEGARFGPRYITGEVGSAIAGHAALDAYAGARAAGVRADAVLLGCFGDPGLGALRALCPVPVLGLAEASMRHAAASGPFVVVTGGPAWAPMLQRLAASLELAAPLLGVQAVSQSGGELAVAANAVDVLRDAARQALARWPHARTVLLGGAGLAGLAAPVAEGLQVPVIDNLEIALDAAFAAASAATPQAIQPADEVVWESLGEKGPWVGLAEPLSQLLESRATRGLA